MKNCPKLKDFRRRRPTPTFEDFYFCGEKSRVLVTVFRQRTNSATRSVTHRPKSTSLMGIGSGEWWRTENVVIQHTSLLGYCGEVAERVIMAVIDALTDRVDERCLRPVPAVVLMVPPMTIPTSPLRLSFRQSLLQWRCQFGNGLRRC